MLSLILPLAYAEPPPRAAEALREQRYARLDDTGGPVRPRWRRRSSGDFFVWEWPDGTVQRVRQVSRGETVSERTFDVQGWPTATARFAHGAPTDVEVHGVGTVSMLGWAPHSIPGAVAWLPLPPGSDDELSMRVGRGVLEVWHDEGSEPLTDGFAAEVAAGCGCTIEDRQVAWIGDRRGVRLRLREARPDGERWADLWAMPDGERTWFASYLADDGQEGLQHGRAVMTLISWRPPPE